MNTGHEEHKGYTKNTKRTILDMTVKAKNQLLTYLIAAVWLVNGLFCKILNLVPRHRQIVARIIGEEHAGLFTVLIGAAETIMAIWILLRILPRLNAIIQMLVIAIMNLIEFFLAPDLLLWGKFNALFAFLFILLIYFNESRLNQKPVAVS